jgi:hypothetical protein
MKPGDLVRLSWESLNPMHPLYNRLLLVVEMYEDRYGFQNSHVRVLDVERGETYSYQPHDFEVVNSR